MISVINFDGMTRVISTTSQLEDLLCDARAVGLTRGLTVLVVGNLVASKLHLYKRTVDFGYLVAQSQELDVSFIFLNGHDTKLDKRIASNLTHTAKIVSTEVG